MFNPRQFPSTAGTIKKYLPGTLARLFTRYPVGGGGGGAVDTNDWCITFTRLIGIVENTSLGTLCNVNSKLNGKSCLIPLVIFGTPLQTLIVPICMQRRVASEPAHQSYNNLAD